MALNIKVGLFGFLDMLKFKNLKKNRETVISESPVEDITCDYVLNNNAKTLHPDFLRLKVLKTAESNGAKVFLLKESTGNPLPFFRAGQYITIKMKTNGGVYCRPFTIASSPAQAKDGLYVISVNSSEDPVSNIIYSHLGEGTDLYAYGPYGNFYYESLRDSSNVVYLADSNGIASAFSMACAIRDNIEKFNLTIMYACNDKPLFKREIESIASTCDKVNIITSNTSLITDEAIVECFPEEDYSLFVSGSSELKKIAESLNLPPRRFRLDTEFCGDISQYEDAPTEGLDKTYSLYIHQGTYKTIIPVQASKTILAALERAGLNVPSACHGGECGLCLSKLIVGNVYVPKQKETRTRAEKAAKFIHPCCTYALSDISIELPGNK